MSEAELQAEVIRLCEERALWWYHAHNSKLDRKGWVDLVILGEGAFFAELKSEDGRRSMDQLVVSRLLLQAGMDYRLWRPSDLASGRIERELDWLC